MSETRAGRLLTDRDKKLYRALQASARMGEPCPTTDEIAEFLGCDSNSTPAASLVRLEQAALIRVRRFQRARVVTITATGESTAEPENAQPHWRDRPMGAAAGALKLADLAQPGSTQIIRDLAAIHGRTVPDLVGEIMKRGLKSMQREMAR